jgi:hypothetical protein
LPIPYEPMNCDDLLLILELLQHAIALFYHVASHHLFVFVLLKLIDQSLIDQLGSVTDQNIILHYDYIVELHLDEFLLSLLLLEDQLIFSYMVLPSISLLKINEYSNNLVTEIKLYLQVFNQKLLYQNSI